MTAPGAARNGILDTLAQIVVAEFSVRVVAIGRAGIQHKNLFFKIDLAFVIVVIQLRSIDAVTGFAIYPV
jgi:hypothetical protein